MRDPRTLLLWLCLLCLPLNATADDRPKGWLGISFEGVDGLTKDARNPHGLGVRVTRVWGESPGHKAGLRVGDVIVSAGGTPFKGPKQDLQALFKQTVAGRHVGDRLRLRVRRVESRLRVSPKGQIDPILAGPRAWLDTQRAGATLKITGQRTARWLELTVTLGRRPGLTADPSVRSNAQLEAAGLYPLVAAGPTAHARFNARMVDASGTRAAYEDLKRRLAQVEAGNDGFRVELVRYVHRDPFKLRAVTDALVRDIRQPFPARQAGRVGFGLLTGTRPPATVRATPARPLSPQQFLVMIEHTLGRAAGLVDEAFKGIPAVDRAFLAANLGQLLDAFSEGIYLFSDKDKKRREKVLRVLRLARRLDYRALHAALDSLTWLYRPGLLRRILARVQWPKAHLARAIVARRNTRWGPILIGGARRNWYRKQDTAVIIDLGGDDLYTNNTAGSVPGKIPVSVVVDLSGDDAYESHRRFTQGCGAMGIGILVDRAGNDSYIGTSFTQGTGYLGVGLLIDDAGDDTYRGLALHQGVGLWGVGALIDKAGDDTYQAQLYSQGVGLSHGVGLLHDLSGNDRYYAKGQRPTGYGTPGIFDAWSQGCGLGFRLDASGGVGLLVDGAGRDRYEAGNFGQGGGYYFAWGILHDAGTDDDTYIASRYGQGWSAHQAVGTFVEAGGDDHYTTRNAVNSGLAWDQCVTLFYEAGGNDTYQGGGFSQGASAHNSICLFYDLGGADHYSRVLPARAGANSYHGGTSWSLFIDAGGGQDTYATQDKARRYRNNTRVTGKTHFAFCDLPGTVAGALK